MIEDIESFSSQRLGPGTLYGALARLEQRGWIEPLPAQQRRRPYQLTAVGEAILREQLSDLERFTQAAGKRLGVSHG